jgi:hypothetical protein
VKLSDLTDEQWFLRLSARRDREAQCIRDWWHYYDGTQPLYYLIRLLSEQDDRFGALTINWCEKFIDSIDRRMFVEGFTLGNSDSPTTNCGRPGPATTWRSTSRRTTSLHW